LAFLWRRFADASESDEPELSDEPLVLSDESALLRFGFLAFPCKTFQSDYFYAKSTWYSPSLPH
jgi:hypothetical protein